MDIHQDITRHVARLSGLTLTEPELAGMTDDLKNIVAYMDLLGELDTDRVEPLTHVLPERNVLRPDEVHPSSPRDTLLQNAPKQKDGFFVVPRTVE